MSKSSEQALISKQNADFGNRLLEHANARHDQAIMEGLSETVRGYLDKADSIRHCQRVNERHLAILDGRIAALRTGAFTLDSRGGYIGKPRIVAMAAVVRRIREAL